MKKGMKVVPGPAEPQWAPLPPRTRSTIKSTDPMLVNRRMSNYTRRQARGTWRASASDGREVMVPEIYNARPRQDTLTQRYIEWQSLSIFIIIRKFFRGKLFGVISALCLLGALYLPDTFVLVQASSATFGDTILTIIMVTFGLEFLLLSITDQSYFLTTWWCMDLVGTLSMVFDIAYLWGSRPDVLKLARAGDQGGDGTGALVYLRAGRMAKLGARAGRISRVLKILRFLPFLQVTEQDSTTMAKKISNQLSQVLGTRVAILTLTLTILMPMPGIFQFPVYDYSLRTVPAALARRAVELVARGSINASTNGIEFRPEDLERFHMEVVNVADFYEETTGYGPYRIFMGKCTEKPPRCEEFTVATQKILPINAWTPRFAEPHRLADSYMISTQIKDITAYDTTLVGDKLASLDNRGAWIDFEFVTAFNFRIPHIEESSWNMGVITFVMGAMIGFGLLLSNSVSELVLRPMERMLQMVREIARTMFTNFRAEEEEEEGEDNDELYDVDNSTEMVLLERIVRRLASMAELTTKQVIDIGIDRGDMKDEDVGIINLMCGGERECAVIQSPAVSSDRTLTGMAEALETGSPKSGIDIPNMDTGFADLGVDEATFYSWDFNPLLIESFEQRIAIPAWIILQHPGSGEFAQKILAPDKLRNCMVRAEKEYMDHPYHNFSHAIDIVHTEHRLLTVSRASSFLSDLEQMTLLIAAVYHDVAHPGVNNPYLIDTAHELALRYNDRSPLENMHCAKLFSILCEKDTAMLDGLTREQYKESRRICVEVILHTDVIQHFGMVKSLNILYQVNSELFDYCDLDYPLSSEEVALYKNPESKKLLMNMFLHTADVANPCKSWPVCRAWAELILEEFFQQGDKEKELGLPVQMLNDRNKVNRPNSQLGFIEFIVCPLIVACVRLFPYLHELGDNLEGNVNQWSGVWVSETNPAQEEIDKVTGRVEKVAESVNDSKIRILNLTLDTDISMNSFKIKTSDSATRDSLTPSRFSKQSKLSKVRNSAMSNSHP
eukprot:GEMP01003782.1.p1 GENE.GEMP01003782.1~~GEMP01003782.1.p1  ORF type:complete len:1012 (+),score=152.37 GEMP01003782.1:411-3446(+)